MFCIRLVRSVRLQKSRNFSLSSSKLDFVRSSVDQSEVDHHKQYADGWWDENNGPMKALHSMNAIRIPFIRAGLTNTGRLKEDEINTSAQYMQGIKILDVGCGGGIMTIPLSRLGAEVTGIDPSKELIDVAKREAEARLSPDCKVQFLTTTIEEHSSSHKELYDVIVLSEVIEHVTKKEEFIHVCVDALKPTGSIFFTTLNRTMASWLGAIVTAEYILNLVPRGTHDWEKFPTPEELQKYLDRAGCKTLLSCGILYLPLLNEWFWIPETSINYCLHAVKQV
ncbi:ubiquinone biosynthesis O-methyltransferase, mitochondrial [Halyomorpha halys]|uniref:ubiquinone biosynthesis O-methyltransferase, mitochondrial n=1 Tax=Halyomorpha halys TaxID=286706 RepID=UPI0006D4F2F6|nr:ubiquinone biosynthesis O-methyltransferase, mitochondrial [Halyomorpha halys]